jgi:ppGpp synthetase/RelA/SpoT-type nucleotidyltranferase
MQISPPIDNFVENYYQSHFTAIAERVKTLINGKLNELHDARTGEGILASVTARAKTPESLRAKLQRKHEQKPKDYESIELIKKNVKDLAGVRIAL